MPLSHLSVPERDRVRADAARMRDLLRGVRDARSDARDFALFDVRDQLAGLGVAREQIDAFDAQDDEALDDHIGQAHAMATAFGAEDDQNSALFGDGGQHVLQGGSGEDVIGVEAPTPPARAAGHFVRGAIERGAEFFAAPIRTAQRLGNEERKRALERAGSAGEPTAHNNRYDAERHARWNYRMAKELGPGWATALGTAYELKEFAPFETLGETLMDLRNNGVGIGQARAGGGAPSHRTPGIVTMERRGSRYPTTFK